MPRIWYGVHPDELNDTYAIRLYLDVCSLIRRGESSPMTDYLFTLLITTTLPSKKINLRDYSGATPLPIDLDYKVLCKNGLPLNWPHPDVPLARRIADIMDWQAICRSDQLSAELLHSIRTYGLWQGGSNELAVPTEVDKVTAVDVVRYVLYVQNREAEVNAKNDKRANG